MEKKVKKFAYVIMQSWYGILKHFLMKNKAFYQNGLDVIWEIALEFLFFNLYFCEKKIKALYGPEHGGEAVKIFINQVAVIFETVDIEDLEKRFNQIKIAGFKKYISYYWSVSFSEDFYRKYNDRKDEFSKFRELPSQSSEDMGCDMLCDFADKIVMLANRGTDGILVKKVREFTRYNLKFISESMRNILGNNPS